MILVGKKSRRGSLACVGSLRWFQRNIFFSNCAREQESVITIITGGLFLSRITASHCDEPSWNLVVSHRYTLSFPTRDQPWEGKIPICTYIMYRESFFRQRFLPFREFIVYILNFWEVIKKKTLRKATSVYDLNQELIIIRRIATVSLRWDIYSETKWQMIIKKPIFFFGGDRIISN